MPTSIMGTWSKWRIWMKRYLSKLTPKLFEKGDAEGSSRFKKVSAIVGLIGGIIAAILGVYQIYQHFQQTSEIRKEVAMRLSIGDRFAEQQDYAMAIQEYITADSRDKDNAEIKRRIVTALKHKFLLEAFGPESFIDIALRPDYESFGHVSDSEINAALTVIYQLQALNPSLKEDVNLLLEEVLILKTRGQRARDAIKVLEKAYGIAPTDPEILAELGLLRAVIKGDASQQRAGLELVRRAIKIRPNEARYHFYLARSLEEIYLCPYVALVEYHGSDDADACAEAIREYHRASELPTAENAWERRIHRLAPSRSLGIFSRYARKEKDILTNKLGMPLDERIKELEYLIPREGTSYSRMGLEDFPLYWMALLCYATGNFDKAERAMRELIEQDRQRGHAEEDQDYWRRKLLWAELYAKILDKTGHEKTTLANIQLAIKDSRLQRKKAG